MNPNLNNVVFYVLVVDDDQDDQYFIRRAINQVIPQAIVDSLYDGDEALEYLKKCAALPNLIILDLNMARLSGKETMRIIRSNESLSTVPVVILTTSHNREEKKELLGMGANAFYTKPHNASELTGIVRDMAEKWLEVYVQG